MSVKQKLYDTCLAQLQSKIKNLEAAIQRIQEAKTNETKSSAGDKYETGRAMMQMEEDKIRAQLDINQNILHQLQRLDIKINTPTVQIGSLVTTSLRHYFIGISLGKVLLDGTAYYCISAQAPLAKVLLGKRTGEEVVFNGKREVVMEVV